MNQTSLFDQAVWDRFFNPGEVMEVRLCKIYGKSSAWPGFARGVVSGYFDDRGSFCKVVKAADQAQHGGIYFTLQVIDPRLIGRAFNRLKPCDVTTSDRDVLAYRWLPVDVDPVRPSGIPSSDSELKAALALRDEVATWVVSEFDFSSPIKANSGNGGHLLFRLPDLPVNDDNRAFIKETLQGLADKFNTDTVTIDTLVFNPARIWKAYGTTAKKGDAVPAGPYRQARPHRLAYIENMGSSNANR